MPFKKILSASIVYLMCNPTHDSISIYGFSISSVLLAIGYFDMCMKAYNISYYKM